MDVVGEYVPVRSTRIDITCADDDGPQFTPWFMEMWDAENEVWRRGDVELPVSRAQYEAMCFEAGMAPYPRDSFRAPEEILPYLVLMAALSALMAVLAVGS